MALISLEIASDGLLASGNSLSIAARGLLTVASVVSDAALKYIGLVSNIGTFMNR